MSLSRTRRMRRVPPTPPHDGVPGRTSRQQVEVETIFGEVFRADAAVVAVGLSLGVHGGSGTDCPQSGRYGEPASDGLLAALERLGLEFGETCLQVGPRLSARNATVCGWLGRHHDAEPGGEEGGRIVEDVVCSDDAGSFGVTTPGGSGRDDFGISDTELGRSTSAGATDPNALTEKFDVQLVRAAVDSSDDCWPAGYPPAPHWQPDLRVERMVMVGGATSGQVGARVPGTLS